MAVYVDALLPCLPNKNWKYRKSCHLYADTESELHEFAISLGLRRSWFQKFPRRLPHYDLTENKRSQALRRGAIDGGREKVVEFIRKFRSGEMI